MKIQTSKDKKKIEDFMENTVIPLREDIVKLYNIIYTMKLPKQKKEELLTIIGNDIDKTAQVEGFLQTMATLI